MLNEKKKYFKNLLNKTNLKKNIFCIIIITLIFFIDRISKIKIIEHQLTNSAFYINDYLNFELVWNTGIAFGLFNLDPGLVYHMFSLLIFVVLLIILFIIFNSNGLEKILFSIILGGGIGNFYDRAFFFAVPDFIDLHINEFHWFTFNIADIFISLGLFLFITKELILKKK